MNSELFFVENIYCPAGTNTMEKELANWLSQYSSHIFDLQNLQDLAKRLKSKQDEIIKDRPRLHAIAIEFKYDSSRWNHGLQNIRFGQCSVCLRTVAGCLTGDSPESPASGR